MFSPQDSFLLGVTLSSTGLSLIHTLHTEFNMFVKSKNKNLDKKESKIQVIENFFQLVYLKSRGKIDQEKFMSLLLKWSKDKGCHLKNSQFFEVEQMNEYSIDDILKALLIVPLEDTGEYITFLTSSIKILNNEYNHFLQKTSNIGFNHNGESIKPIQKETLDLMDQIFNVFDHKRTGNIQADRLYFLYLALLCCQPNPSFQVNQTTFLRDINSSFDCFLKRTSCFYGRITSRQFKAYLIFNNLVSKESLETLYKSAKFIAELGPQLNENLQQSTEGLLPSLLLIALKTTLPKAILSDLRKNTLDIQLLCHCLLTKFFPIAHENNHFKGLCVVRKTLLSQFFLKHLRESYQINMNAVYWRFNLSQTILTIVQNYTHIALETLRFSLTWLLSQKNCPFQKPNTILSPYSVLGKGFTWDDDKLVALNIKPPQNPKTKEPKEDAQKKESSNASPVKIRVLTVDTKEEPTIVWQTNFLDVSPKPSRHESPKISEGKVKTLAEPDVVLETGEKAEKAEKAEKKRRTTTTSIMSKKSQSRRETSETSKNFFLEENSRIVKTSIQEQTLSPVTGTLVEQIEDQEPRKLSGRYEIPRRNTKIDKIEEVKWHYRDNSETNLIEIVKDRETEKSRSSISPKTRFVVRKEDVDFIDQPAKVVKKEKVKIVIWEEIEKMRNQNNKAWKSEKVLLENITKESKKRTPTGSSLERIKEIFKTISPKEHVKTRSGYDSEVSDETDFSNQREARGEFKLREKDQHFKK